MISDCKANNMLSCTRDGICNERLEQYIRVLNAAQCPAAKRPAMPWAPRRLTLRWPRGTTGVSLSVDCGKRLPTHVAKARHCVAILT